MNNKILMHTLIVTLLTGLLFTSCKGIKESDEAHISTTDFKTKIALNGAQLVDVRTPIEYNQGHIENATLIDFNGADFLKNATGTLDKSKPVYVYCLSGGKRSQTSVEMLKAEGYDVQDLKGGIAGWTEKGFKTVKTEDDTETIIVKKSTIEESVTPINKSTTSKDEKDTKKVVERSISDVDKKKEIVREYKQVAVEKNEVKNEVKKEIKEVVETVQQKLTPEIVKVNTATFKSKIDGKNVQLIDVRTPKEYKNGHISKAKNINIFDNDFLQQATSLNKTKPVYVYCRSGVRSMKAANKLKGAGFKVYNLNGGIKGWQKDGNKIEK